MSTIIDKNVPSGAPLAGIPANRDRLFLASCVALIVTAMTFAIRAGILNELSFEFGLNNVQLGWVNSMAFLGFPIAMLIGGLIYNTVGPRVMMWIAFVSHLLGLILTITAGGFFGLVISTFLIGFANGSVEAACNPMIADMYPDKRTEMLNKFHVWFPGGIVIGALIAQAFQVYLPDLSWQVLIGTMFIPTLLYGFLIFGQPFPRSENIASDTGSNIVGLATPIWLFIALCMAFTASSEFATTQWVEKILGGSGAQPIIVLALVSGVMALGRYFGGPYVHRLNTAAVLLGSAILASVGVYLLSTMDGGALYFAAFIFALGVCFFWPNMIAISNEQAPQTGALGMSIVGGIGMFSMVIMNPIIGDWLDSAQSSPAIVAAAAAAASGDGGTAADTDAVYQEALAAKEARQQVEDSGDLITAAGMPDFMTHAVNASATQFGGDDFDNAVERARAAADVAAGREVMSSINIIPIIAAVLLGILFFWTRSRKANQTPLAHDTVGTAVPVAGSDL